jgi:hypothetical protein
MHDLFDTLMGHQFEAALCMLNACVNRCPDAVWNSRVANFKFCQVVFHTLFFTDFYLGQNEELFRQQRFHRANEHFFGDYEEFEDRLPVRLYEKAPIHAYLEHCRTKATEVWAAETAQTLRERSGFGRRDFSRAELHVYNLRHIQHHAAQLSLRLRLDTNEGIPWVGSGWSTKVSP